MFRKIFKQMMSLAMAVLVVSMLLAIWYVYDYFAKEQMKRLSSELEVAVSLFNSALTPGAYPERLSELENSLSESSIRITRIGGDGDVLFDSWVDARKLKNHGDRAEVKAAILTGRGSDSRLSSTFAQKFTYVAARLVDGSVVRLSGSSLSYFAILIAMSAFVLLAGIVVLTISIILSRRMARAIVEPLNTLDLDRPLKNDIYDELSPLLHRIHLQNEHIQRQMNEIERRSDEFRYATDNLKEGLILIDIERNIIFMNPSAMRMFNACVGGIGQHYLNMDRSKEIDDAISGAILHGHAQAFEEVNGRKYQFELTRMETGGNAVGVVMLVFDITDRMRVEQKRKEFTSNVTHELKTPLQSIMGSAELLEAGFVNPGDERHFYKVIRRESQNLLKLIEDLLMISKLDEGIEIEKTEFDLETVVADVYMSLEAEADHKKIQLKSKGKATLFGVRSIFYEIIYNLIENGIKYNVPGGSVEIELKEEKEDIVLIVTDTGIGIPKEELEHVFERFYRVDKSHSKSTGGTGLGLSIVKNAVRYHGGEIRMESEPGKGSRITIFIPFHAYSS